jgi:ribosomal protein S18 acetylase RimI-like enzyme
MTEPPSAQDITVRVLASDEAGVLDQVAPLVFDWPIESKWCAEFFADARHHLAVAIDGDVVVGMVTALHYVHPDKRPEMYINELGVAPTHQGQGIGKRLMQCLFQHARTLGCQQAWLITDKKNTAARELYKRVGGQESADKPVYYSFRLGNDQ